MKNWKAILLGAVVATVFLSAVLYFSIGQTYLRQRKQVTVNEEQRTVVSSLFDQADRNNGALRIQLEGRIYWLISEEIVNKSLGESENGGNGEE